MSRRRRDLLLLVWLQAGVLLCLLAAYSPSAERYELSVPYKIHVPLLLKLVSKSRSLPERLRGEVVIEVSGNRSLSAIREIAEGSKLLGRPIRVADAADRSSSPDIIYLGPDADLSVQEACARARQTGAITVTGVAEFVEQGVALGVKLSSSRRPKILVNLGTARQERIDLPAAILGIAEVIDQ